MNVAGGKGAQASIIQRGRPMLVEFWDFCRPNSLRTLPYMRAWHERYVEHGLRMIGVHSPGFDPSREEQAVRDAVARLGYRVPGADRLRASRCGRSTRTPGWPARYLFDGHARLFEYHYGEGAYAETELAIQELLGVEREPLRPLRPEDAPDALLVPQTEDQPGAYSGPYEAGGVWAVLAGAGTVLIGVASTDGDSGDTSKPSAMTELEVSHPGAYPLIEHDRHTAGLLGLEIGPGVECYATCFTPGVLQQPDLTEDRD